MDTAPESDRMGELSIPTILQLGFAGCFIGHGAFGLITKAAWVPYFAVGGISEPWAWRLMPWIGAMDISLGLLVFIWPCRALFNWGMIWCVWTALLRPLSGEPFWEALERAGNYGMPLAMLMTVSWTGPQFARQHWPEISPEIRARLAWTLRLTTVALLVGHAGLGYFSHKAGLAQHYGALGFSQPAALVPEIGAFEFIIAAFVLVLPSPMLLFFVCLWKIATESLFLVSGAPSWELIERFGSYAAPLALAFVLFGQTTTRTSFLSITKKA